jgi:hypothetical protein
MSEPTAAVVDAPAPPDPSSLASLADYEAARPQLLRDSAQPPARGESADAIRTRLLQEQDARTPTRDERGRFARTEGDAPLKAEAAAPADAPLEAEAPKPRKNPQERIDRIVWEREQARRDAEAARQELAALRAQLPPPPPAEVPRQAPPAPGDSGDPEPTEEQFETYREYVRAQAQWAARQQLQQFVQFTQQQAAQHEAAQYRATAASTFADRMQAAQAAEPALLAQIRPELLNLRPSFSLQPGERPTGETVIADLVLQHEQPERLLTALSQDDDTFRRIGALHPMLAMRELGRLEARLDAASSGSVSQPSLSQAKPPIQPVGRGASVPPGARDPKDISSLAEWEAVRRSFGAR